MEHNWIDKNDLGINATNWVTLILGIKNIDKNSTQKVLIKSTHAIYFFPSSHQQIKCPIPIIPLLSKSCVGIVA